MVSLYPVLPLSLRQIIKKEKEKNSEESNPRDLMARFVSSVRDHRNKQNDTGVRV